MKVLLLEDEEGIRSFVRINLKRQGFEVIETTTGEEALTKFHQMDDISIAVLDVMLPDMDGFAVCKQIRQKDTDIGIIMLTAKSQMEDKLEGFDCGADDYISKPFSPAELIARMKVLGKRLKTKKPANVLALAPFTLQLEQRKLDRSGSIINLTPKEFEILKILMEKPNTAVSRDEILNQVWGKHYVGDLKTVDIHIRRLRKKVEDDPSEPIYLETIWGFGYLWRHHK
ncbi:response regulator transcription factor [Shimazuella kribbensis]|uniref:response regulator transcription factor n=1 Tax=Shimazuella kribbensis TaxID=139808 RepID=UPI000413FAEA|nr:response regulator transcription factor [Shimazuella kribbensis]